MGPEDAAIARQVDVLRRDYATARSWEERRTQAPGVALASLNRLTTETLLSNWLHGRQPILPDEGETEALPKHR